MGKETSSKKQLLALTDASAGFIAAALLFLVQKLPESSDAKQLYLYASPVVALILNNFFFIIYKSLRFMYVSRQLESQKTTLSQKVEEYVKTEGADPEVIKEYNYAIRNTHLAIIENSMSNMDEELLSEVKSRRAKPKRVNVNNSSSS